MKTDIQELQKTLETPILKRFRSSTYTNNNLMRSVTTKGKVLDREWRGEK
jgi:hypothetical protein